MAGYVLDTSAMIAYLYDEHGAETVEEVVESGEEVLAPFIAIMEVRYKLLRELGDDIAEPMSVLMGWPMQVVESYPEWGHTAATVKAPGRISTADAWVAALALLQDARLVHKDPEFDAVKGLNHLRLPYDRGRSRA